MVNVSVSCVISDGNGLRKRKEGVRCSVDLWLWPRELQEVGPWTVEVGAGDGMEVFRKLWGRGKGGEGLRCEVRRWERRAVLRVDGLV
jgi:hypothetical protein